MITTDHPKTMTADIDDLNRTLYDIGAQDLLDVWEAMDAQVRMTVGGKKHCKPFSVKIQ